MIFCGQCGFQLAPGTTQCPRCGAKVEETNGQPTELHSDDATIATHSMTVRNTPGQSQVSPPQPLILRPGANSNDYGSQMAYDATSRVEAPNYGTQIPQNPHLGSAYPSSYPQQSGSAYPPPQGNYSDFANRPSGTYGGGGYPMNTQGGYQQPYTQDTNKVRVTALVLGLKILHEGAERRGCAAHLEAPRQVRKTVNVRQHVLSTFAKGKTRVGAGSFQQFLNCVRDRPVIPLAM